jgi:hypothetical protein
LIAIHSRPYTPRLQFALKLVVSELTPSIRQSSVAVGSLMRDFLFCLKAWDLQTLITVAPWYWLLARCWLAICRHVERLR